jgi:hypothetical protein
VAASRLADFGRDEPRQARTAAPEGSVRNRSRVSLGSRTGGCRRSPPGRRSLPSD